MVVFVLPALGDFHAGRELLFLFQLIKTVNHQSNYSEQQQPELVVVVPEQQVVE